MNRNRLGTSFCGARAGLSRSLSRAPCRPQRRRTSARPISSGCRIRSTRRAATSPRLRSSNTDLAARLQTELDDLRDEVVYLKVKMRKEGNINRSDYADVRDKLSDLRTPCAR